MLVLTRKVGEKIVVPQCQLTVTVLEITSSRVRLGVSAPAGVAVHREEVAETDFHKGQSSCWRNLDVGSHLDR